MFACLSVSYQNPEFPECVRSFVRMYVPPLSLFVRLYVRPPSKFVRSYVRPPIQVGLFVRMYVPPLFLNVGYHGHVSILSENLSKIFLKFSIFVLSKIQGY